MRLEEQIQLKAKGRDALADELRTLDAELSDIHASDEWTPEKREKYNIATQTYLRKHAQHQRANTELAELTKARPATRKSFQQSPLQRFLNGGAAQLSAEEREIHLGDPSPEAQEAQQQMGGQPGMTFRIGTTPEMHADFLARGGAPLMAGNVFERSDLATGNGAVGPAVPEQWSAEVVHRLAYIGGISPFCTTFITETGGDFHINGIDDASEVGAALPQSSPNVAPGGGIIAASAFAATAVVFKSWRRSSNAIWLKRQAQRDVHFSMVQQADMMAARRLERGFHQQHIEGDGTTEPQGLETIAREGHEVAATGNPVYDDIVELVYSVNRAYRSMEGEGAGGFMGLAGGRVGHIISDDMEMRIVQMEDTDGRPLWSPMGTSGDNAGMVAGPPGRILGFPYMVAANIDSYAANSLSWYFGNFSYFGIRTVGTVEILTFFDSYTALQDASVCIGFAEKDSRAMGAITSNKCEAISYLKGK